MGDETHAKELAICQHALFEAGCEEVDVVLHQLVYCSLGSTWCGLVVWAGIRLVFRGVQTAHEGPPIGLDDF